MRSIGRIKDKNNVYHFTNIANGARACYTIDKSLKRLALSLYYKGLIEEKQLDVILMFCAGK